MLGKEWWKKAVVYQVYPKSFQDSNGDGRGDLRGIIRRLDYIKELGANVLWLCPVYKSPMFDNGYDIADYYHVDPSFGTDEDMDELIAEAKKRGIGILMDLVVNHTSSEHPWFQAALQDPEGKYGKYYVFQKGRDGREPSNLRSYFGGSVWEPVGKDGLYYFHSFAKEQPDLNWENPELREEIYRMVNHWLDKGICGFRIDAIGNIKKDLSRSHYPEDGPDGRCYAGTWIQNQPGIEKFLHELDDRTFRLHNSMTVAEVGVPEERLGEFIGKDGFFRMVFDFSYTDIDVPASAEWYKPTGWTIGDMRERIFHSQLVTEKIGWGCAYLENHDQPRSVNKYIPQEDINDRSKKALAALFLCLRGTPFVYQGQEIGMTNIRMESMEDYDDIASRDQYARALKDGVSPEDAFEAILRRSRDNSRTPMQWDVGECAGFTNCGHTWLKVNENCREINVKEQENRADSVLSFYKRLIALRRESEYQELLTEGRFVPWRESGEKVIAYLRETEDRKLLVACNLGNAEDIVKLPQAIQKVLLGNYPEAKFTQEELMLRSYECVIAEL